MGKKNRSGLKANAQAIPNNLESENTGNGLTLK